MSTPQTSSPTSLPGIPDKRYFAIGEVSDLCGVKPHVLRYWEQEFTQLKPMKRRGNRRYYRREDVLVVRQIRDLLYEQGFTISGARQRLRQQSKPAGASQRRMKLKELRHEVEELLALLDR
jgi:DNA-binding transcriptional MerR regulator